MAFIEETSTAESSVAGMIGSAFEASSAKSEKPAEEAAIEPSVVEESEVKYDFEDGFQTRLASLVIRDVEFMNRAGHLVQPEYFENAGEAILVNLAKKYFDKYKSLPEKAVMAELIKDARKSKIIKDAEVPIVVESFKTVFSLSAWTSSEYVEEKVAQFARHQATTQAILRSVDLIGRGEFEKIEKDIKRAIEIGVNEDGGAYDYFANIGNRTAERLDEATGVKAPRGITSGNLKLDEVLYHRGWGRKELVSLMGGPKSGKTTALIGFAKAASLAKYNVLYVTLEVSAKIISERLDASVSDTEMKALKTKIRDVEAKVAALESSSGKLIIHEYPSGTCTPNMLRSLLKRYKAKGVLFDLVVVDYADIMAPNHRYNDPIENSKSIYIDLRAIAQEMDVAMLTATQTNREGYKSTVAKAEHVAEDFNKVRTVDLLISINVTEEERSKGEARLFFAASRNQESGFTLFIKQDIAKMKFIESIIRRE